MKLFYFHPELSYNIGDDVILSGIRNLMKEIDTNIQDISWYSETETELPLEAIKNSDLLVAAGTPWIWEGSENSGKYAQLKRLVNLFQGKKKIALGIGSCYKLEYTINNIAPTSKFIEFWKDFDLITTRDSLATQVLDKAGIKNIESFCPSGFSNSISKTNIDSEIPGLIYYNPLHGLSRSVLSDEFIKNYNEFQFNFIKRYNAKAYAITQVEISELSERGITGTRLKTIDDIFTNMKTHKHIVSGRIHSAIPASLCGNYTEILPVDSRWLTTTKYNIMPIFEQDYQNYKISNNPRYIDKEKLNESKQNILDSIRKIL